MRSFGGVLAAACWLLAGLFVGSLPAAAPDLAAGVPLYDGDAPLAVDLYAAPTVCDWNNDGRKDLLVGEFYYGNVHLFLNVSTSAIPRFAGSSHVLASGVALATSYG